MNVPILLLESCSQPVTQIPPPEDGAFSQVNLEEQYQFDINENAQREVSLLQSNLLSSDIFLMMVG